jgi:hypothetical protein
MSRRMERRSPAPMVSPECTGTVVVLPSECFRKTWLPRVRTASKPAFQGCLQPLCPSGAEGGSYRNLLNANKLQRATLAVIGLQAQFDHFAGTLHEGIKVLRLRMTARQTRDRRNVVTFLVAFNDHSKFALGSHKAILSLRGCRFRLPSPSYALGLFTLPLRADSPWSVLCYGASPL